MSPNNQKSLTSATNKQKYYGGKVSPAFHLPGNISRFPSQSRGRDEIVSGKKDVRVHRSAELPVRDAFPERFLGRGSAVSNVLEPFFKQLNAAPLERN